IWMAVNSPYFTRRFAAPSQNVLDQMQRNFPQEASTSGHDFDRLRGEIPSSGHDFSRAVRNGKEPALAAEGVALPSPNKKIVIPSAARNLLLLVPSSQRDSATNSPVKAAIRP